MKIEIEIPDFTIEAVTHAYAKLTGFHPEQKWLQEYFRIQSNEVFGCGDGIGSVFNDNIPYTVRDSVPDNHRIISDEEYEEYASTAGHMGDDN